MKKIILYNEENEPYFMVNKEKWFFKNISSDGYNLTMFTNIGYIGGYILEKIEYGINDYAVLKKVIK